jgi:hypothetical protein
MERIGRSLQGTVSSAMTQHRRLVHDDREWFVGGFNRTAATAPLFKCFAPSESADEKMVTLTFASWNRIGE